MTYLKTIGFQIFRLREARQDSEFLIFDSKKGVYNCYSEKRVLPIIMMELKERKFDLIKFVEEELKIDTKGLKPKRLLSNWIEEETILIDNIGYKPIDDLIFEKENRNYFNLYRKADLLNMKPKNKKYSNIKDLIMNLVGHNEENFNYFCNWIAWQIKNPLQRLPTSIIFQGEQGTGKTQFCNLVLKALFGKNFCEIGQTDINKEYNDFIIGKQLIVANEVIHNDNKLLIPDKLKNYVTDEYLSINRKFKDTIYVENYAQWIFVTNNQVPLKIERGDRRYTVFKSKKLVNGRKLIRKLKENLNNELEGFLYYLLSLNPNDEYVGNPLENEAKQDIIKASQNSVYEFYDYVIDLGGFDIYIKSINISFTDLFIINNTGTYIKIPKLYELYTLYCLESGVGFKFTRTNFTRQFKQFGFSENVVKEDGKPIRCLLMKNEN